MILAERSNEAFNSMLDIEDVYKLSKISNIDKFLELASSIATSRKIDSRIGCFILHRHNLLQDNEVMLRGERASLGGKAGIVTRATDFSHAISASPVSFKLQCHSGEVILTPLEYSTLPSDRKGYEALCESKDFLLEFYNLAKEMNLDQLVGISIISKLIPTNEKEVVVERFAIHEGAHENIVSMESVDTIKHDNAIPTTWSLFGNVTPQSCLRMCVDRSPGHSKEHVSCSNWA